MFKGITEDFDETVLLTIAPGPVALATALLSDQCVIAGEVGRKFKFYPRRKLEQTNDDGTTATLYFGFCIRFYQRTGKNGPTRFIAKLEYKKGKEKSKTLYLKVVKEEPPAGQ